MIIIDPGHGGKDSGAVGIDGTLEKDINLQISRHLYLLLTHLGIECRLTRYDDNYPDWENRVDSSVGDTYISIHCNSTVNQKAEGIETLYYPSSTEGRELAKRVQKELISTTDRYNRGIVPRDGLYVLKRTKCPAILVECGFLSNKEECELLNSLDYQAKIVSAISNVIEEVV